MVVLFVTLFGLVSGLVTVALTVCVPVAVAVTWAVKVALAPAARAPTVNVSGLPLCPVKPEGKVTVTVELSAGKALAPVLDTVMVMVTPLPTPSGGPEAAIVTLSVVFSNAKAPALGKVAPAAGLTKPRASVVGALLATPLSMA